MQRGVVDIKLPAFLLACSRVSDVANTRQGSYTGTKESKNTTAIYGTRSEMSMGKLEHSAAAVVSAGTNCLNMLNPKHFTNFERKLGEAKYASS